MAIRTVGLLLLLGMAVSVVAQQFEYAVSGVDYLCYVPPAVTEYAVFHPFEPPRPDLAREEPRREEDIRMIASGAGAVVYGLRPSGAVVRFSGNGTPTPFFGGIAGAQAHAIAVAPSGRVYLRVTVGGSERLAVISPAGAQEALHPLPGPAAYGRDAVLAVAPDGCTVYYATATAIRRINGCTGASLPDFAALANVHDAEVLPGGELLVSAGATVLQYSSSGVLMRTVASLPSYGFNAGASVEEAAVANGVLWIHVAASCETTLLRVSFDTGAEVRPRAYLDFVTGTGLVVSPASHATVPAAGAMGLILTAFALAAAGALVLRLRGV